MATVATDKRARFSLLWVFVMLNMVYADIPTFMMAGTLKDILAGHVGQIEFTPNFLLLAAVMTEVPIAMVVLSLVLPHRAARWPTSARPCSRSPTSGAWVRHSPLCLHRRHRDARLHHHRMAGVDVA